MKGIKKNAIAVTGAVVVIGHSDLTMSVLVIAIRLGWRILKVMELRIELLEEDREMDQDDICIRSVRISGWRSEKTYQSGWWVGRGRELSKGGD